MSIWDSIKDTAKSLGGAAGAPAGLVWDIASSPFDDDENDNPFSMVMNRGGQLLDPLLNEDTFTGYGAGRVMDAANWAMREGISEPIGTAVTMAQHATQGDSVGERFGTLFSGDAWARAYEISQNQNAGQALANMVLDTNAVGQYDTDPFDYEDPYEQNAKKEHPVAAPVISWGANIAGSLALDPFYIAGKGLGVARQGVGPGKALFGGDFSSRNYAKLNAGQKADLGALLNGGNAKAESRINRWADFVGGKNAEGRALTGPEVLAATPELSRWAKEPRVVSALVADAAKIENPAMRRNTIKDIIAVAGGDVGALDRLQDSRYGLASIADQLKNMRRGNVLDLEKLTANPELQFSPLFTQHLERQLANLNSDKGIDRAIRLWEDRIDLIERTHGTVTHLPGYHARQASRGLRTLNDKGLGQKLSQGASSVEAKAIEKVDEVTARIAAKSSHSLMVQKGLRAVPVLAIKSTAFAAAPYTKFPAAMAGAMRQTHFTGVARFDEWDDAVTQFDSMLKMSHVPSLDRMNFISKATLAGGEMEKEAMVRQAERLAMTSLTKHLSEKTGESISTGYIEALMENHFKQRGARMSQLYGRAYAATKMAPEQQDATFQQAALRQGNIAKAEDGAKLAGDQANWSLRVDQFLDDDGMPVALPLLESQLRNAVPLLDMHLAKKLVGRDQSHLARLGRAWDKQAEEIHGLETRLGRTKGRAAEGIKKQLDRAYAAQDWIGELGSKSLRVWKMSVLFRLGYPARVVLDDHWRIWSRIGAGTFYAQNAPEAVRNLGYNQVGRYRQAGHEMAAMRAELGSLKDELRSDRIANYQQRLEAHRKAANSLRAHKGQLTKLRNKTANESHEASAIGEKIAHHEQQVARFEAEVDRLQQQMGDMSPEDIQRRMSELNEALRAGVKGNLPEKKTIGSADVELSGGEVLPGAFAGPQGRAFRSITGSEDTFDYQIRGVEEKTYGRADRGAHVTINPDAPHHLDAWADSLNNQIKNSRVAMYFVKGGDANGFAKWIREPEQADLRRRLPHLAHDPEEWGARIESMVDDYLPTTDLREAIKKGTVTPKWLAKHHPDGTRPAVHGPMVADTLGTSDRALGIGRRVNDTFTWLASQPTDRLSRHPFFNSMYKMHAEEFAEVRRVAAREQGRSFTQADLDFIERQARRAALVDLKRTLFDMSAHSHAAHVMRFISPFFAAHQEVITRWWRIVQDNPGIVRRVQQAFDAPRYAGIVVDENGDPVEPGEMPSPKHKILLPIPWADGADWSINENSFNLILQNGITNPGVGPLVQMPLETLAAKYPEDEEIARVARIFSPFPPDSPIDAIMPATFKRLMAAIHGSSGKDTGVGTREFNDLYATNITDRVVDFHLKNGREPNQSEMDDIWEAAKHESTVEAWLKFVQNAGSPFPARPNSRYAAIQQGWYKLSEMGRQKYPNDFVEARDWATEKFKEQYGEAYLALTYSDVNNPAGVDGSPAEVAAWKRYKSVLDKTDPRLARGIIGPALTALDEQGVSTSRTDEGRNWFEDQGLITTDDPEAAAKEAQARRGWAMLDDLTNRLNMAAEQMGLRSYVENDKLVLARKTALAAIKAENDAFKSDIESIDGDSYDSLLREMTQLTENRQLRNDPTRTDIDTLEAYLQLRAGIMSVIQQRQEAGLGGPDAQATVPIREAYTRAVAALAAQNTFFESGFYNGVIERDPLLIGLE